MIDKDGMHAQENSAVNDLIETKESTEKNMGTTEPMEHAEPISPQNRAEEAVQEENSQLPEETLPDAPPTIPDYNSKGTGIGRFLRAFVKIILPVLIIGGIALYFFWPRPVVKTIEENGGAIIFVATAEEFQKKFNQKIKDSGTGYRLLSLEEAERTAYDSEEFADTKYEGKYYYSLALEGDVYIYLICTEEGNIYEVFFGSRTMGEEAGKILHTYTFAAFDVLVGGSERMDTETPEQDMIKLQNGDFTAASLDQESMSIHTMYYVPVQDNAKVGMGVYYYLYTDADITSLTAEDVEYIEYAVYAFQ